MNDNQEEAKLPNVDTKEESHSTVVEKKVPQMIIEEAEEDANLSAEEVDSDDMAGGLCDSDSDEGEERRAVFKVMRAEKRGAKSGGVAAEMNGLKPKTYK